MAITATIQGGAVQLSGIPVWIHCTGGAAPADSSGYKILLKIISTDGQLIGAPHIDAISPDTSGEAWFNISGYVDQPVKAEFQYPPSGAVVVYPSKTLKIKIQPGESYIDSTGVLQEVWGGESEEVQILKGGVSQRQIAMWETNSTNFYDEYLVKGRFLTHRPWGDWVHPLQPVKLWFIPVSEMTGTLKIKYFYYDNSEGTYSVPVSLSPSSVYEFNCNPKWLGVDLEANGKRVSFYDVWLESGGEEISDSRRFTIDWKPCERPFFMLFANSIGGVDDIYLSGYAVEKFKSEGTTVYRPAQRGDKVYDPTLIVPNRLGQNTFSINTGYKVPTQMRHLRDLLVARQVWLLYPNLAISSFIIIPVIIDNSDSVLIDYYERANELDNLDLEISEAIKSQFSFDNRLY